MDFDDSSDALARIHETVPQGGAICLLGAGFSMSARDQKGEPVPGTQALIDEIKKSVHIDPEESVSLADIADFCAETTERTIALRNILVNRLTLCVPSNDQKIIINQKWRSIFTTNFDDITERCRNSNEIQVYSPSSDIGIIASGKTPIYYMHGRAKDILDTDKNPGIVISERNYIELQENNKKLYSLLSNELFCANLIVIIGYSLKDLEIARVILGTGDAFRRKTIIICGEDERQVSISRLSKFGRVLPIGTAKLADRLNTLSQQQQPSRTTLQFLNELFPPERATGIESADFIKHILTGNFDPCKYAAQVHNNNGENYCIRRSQSITSIVNRSDGHINRFLVSSDIAMVKQPLSSNSLSTSRRWGIVASGWNPSSKRHSPKLRR